MRTKEESLLSSTGNITQIEDEKRTKVVNILKWNAFTSLCDDLYKKLMLESFDGIISIGRGGTIVGAIMASKLGARIYPVFVIHRGESEDKSTEIIRLDATTDLKRGRYLL